MPAQAKLPTKWVNDSQRLLLEHFDAISNSPSHIYYSALPFSPSSSWLRNCYSAELSQGVDVLKGLPAEWGMCSRTVSLHDYPQTFVCWRDTVAVGLQSGKIITLDGITGSQAATLSGCTSPVKSLAFSSDGASLLSGSGKVVTLWDIQTGGVIKTFCGHTNWVYSVSISADCIKIASGSEDKTIRLWDIQTGECSHIIEHQSWVATVNFSPTNPLHLISISGGKVQQWNVDGHKFNSTHDGSHVTFSLDGTQFVLCSRTAVEVRDSGSGELITKFTMSSGNTNNCCFSPDGRLVAVNAGNTVYVWDITESDPCIIETFIGHTGHITSLAFSSPSSLISSSRDKSARFWQVGTPSTDLIVPDPKSTPLSSAPIRSVTLQAEAGIAISSDSNGVVGTWDILTGHNKELLKTPAKNPHRSDVRLIDGRLIFVWQEDTMVHIWDVKRNESIQTVDAPGPDTESIKISGDGSKVFCLYWRSIKAWSIWTGQGMGEAEVEIPGPQRYLTVDGPKVWVHSPLSESQGWDFGILDSSPAQLPNMPALHLNDTRLWDIKHSRIKDTDTGRVIFQLPVRFVKYANAQWDGFYLVVLCGSGEVLILDFSSMLQ